MWRNQKILLVSPHPDDAETACGGTISKYARSNEMRSIVFAPCLEDQLNKGIINEHRKAMNTLGVSNLVDLNLPRDVLEDHKQQIRNILHELKEQFEPNIVFCPSFNDMHQDHRAIASCCNTIYRDSATLLSYEIMRSTVEFKPNLFIVLSKAEMLLKLKALACYKTQYRRVYWRPSIFRGLARFRGSQINVAYAEAFELMRMTDR